MKRRISAAASLALMAFILSAGPSAAQKRQPEPPSARPAGAPGTVVVPDRFLRRWDPLTVFFARDPGPPAAGPRTTPSAS